MTALKTFARLILFFLFFVSTTDCFAQNEAIAALKKQLSVATSPHALSELNSALAYEMRGFNSDSSLQYAKTALTVAEKDNYEYGKALADLCVGLAYGVKGNFSIDKEYSNRSLALGEKLNNDSIIGSAELSLASAYTYLGDYEPAMESALQSIKSYEKINNDLGITKARLIMAQLYQSKGDLNAATDILKDLADKSGQDKKIQINIYHTLANIYGEQGNYKDALALDDKALLICDAAGMPYLKSPVFDNMANCFMYNGNTAKAAIYFYKCLELDSSFGNKKQMADTYLNLGQLAIMTGDYPAAIRHLKHSVVLSKESSYRQGTYSAYILLSDAFSKNNEKDSALVAVNKGYQLKDSMINQRSEDKIAELETLYQSERKEQQLALQKSELNKKNSYLVALSIAILLIIFIRLFLFP